MSNMKVAGFAGMLVLLVAALVGCGKTGSLQVTLTPQAAVDAGAQWRVDGAAWQVSGATVSGLPNGVRPVTFKDINGWTSPTTQQGC